MTNSVSTLLIRNLDDIFGENDPERRRTAMHPHAGLLAFEYSALAVDGRPDLSMVIYTPARSADAERIRSPLGGNLKPSRSRAAPR